ncbi:MAG: TlpA family protein disulfide reductase [Anaerolineae bacterium]|nr:TlpA family protein disulfide reductase [Anaerolineae bacterium]
MKNCTSCFTLGLLLTAMAAGLVTACGAATPPLEIGQPAPDFCLPDAAGQEIALSDLQGRVVLLNFWATWCEPCKAEMPIFQSLYESYGGDDFVVVLIALGDEPGEVAEYVDGHGYTFVSLVDSDGTMERTYGIDTLPSTLLIDQAGVLRNFRLGPVHDEATLLAEISPLLPALVVDTGPQESPAPALPPTEAAMPGTPPPSPAPPTATVPPAPTPTATATPAPTTALDTPTPTPTPRRFPAPLLTAPNDGIFLPAGTYAELRWAWEGELAADEYFDLRFWREGAAHNGIAWTQEPYYAVAGDPGVAYYWAVAVIRGAEGEMLEQLSAESAARRIQWLYPSPTPTPVPPVYGLALRCGDCSLTAPPGQMVVFFVEVLNTGNVQDTYDVSMSKALPGGWRGMFCIGDECYTGGTHPITVGAGGTGIVEIKLESAGDAPPGQSGRATLGVVSQGDPSQSGSITATLTVE